MKRLLITGFVPFGGDRVNPALQAVQALPETIGKWELYKREMPVSFRGAPKALSDAITEVEPDAVLMIGVAASRGMVTPERQGVNEIVARTRPALRQCGSVRVQHPALFRPVSAGAGGGPRARGLHPRARHPGAGGGEGPAHPDLNTEKGAAVKRQRLRYATGRKNG